MISRRRALQRVFRSFRQVLFWSCCCHQLYSFLFQVQVMYCSVSRASATIFKTWFVLLFEILVFTNFTDVFIHCKHKLVYLEFLGTRNSEMLAVLCDSVWLTVSCNLHQRDFTFHFSKWINNILMPFTFSTSVGFLSFFSCCLSNWLQWVENLSSTSSLQQGRYWTQQWPTKHCCASALGITSQEVKHLWFPQLYFMWQLKREILDF